MFQWSCNIIIYTHIVFTLKNEDTGPELEYTILKQFEDKYNLEAFIHIHMHVHNYPRQRRSEQHCIAAILDNNIIIICIYIVIIMCMIKEWGDC